MRVVVCTSLLLMASVLTGCINEAPRLDAGPEEPSDDDLPAGVARFDGAGAVHPLDPNSTAVPFYGETGHRGAEPNMGITSTGSVFASASSDIIRSRDHGETWESVHTHELMNSDPMMWVDPWTDHIYNAPMFPILLCATIYHSSDDGDTWSDLPSPNCGRSVYDHQKLASGPPGPDAPPIAGEAHPTVLYVCYNAVATTNCAISYDNGRTWPHDVPAMVNLVPAQPASGCGSGQNGHPTVSHDGIVAFAKTWLCDEPYLVYSTDSGLTWTVVDGPQGKGAGTLDPEIAFTPDGTLYYLYSGSDHRKYLARTSDLGQSWDGPWRVSPPNVTSTAFDALGAGDDGRIAMSFLGTEQHNATDPSEAPNETRWHLYTVVSDDAGADLPTFTSYQVTPEADPVQIGCVWLGGGGDPCRNMLDFIDGGVHPDGTWFTAYTEGCSIADACGFNENATHEDSRSRMVAMARLDGFRLYEDPAPSPPMVAEPPPDPGAVLTPRHRPSR